MKVLISVIVLLGLSACGVKGRPLPPLDPPEIGDGKLDFSQPEDDEREEELSSEGQGS